MLETLVVGKEIEKKTSEGGREKREYGP